MYGPSMHACMYVVRPSAVTCSSEVGAGVRSTQEQQLKPSQLLVLSAMFV